MASSERIAAPAFRRLVTDAAGAAARIADGALVGFSGFTGAGYPKAVPAAIAARARAEHAAGRPFQIGVLTGASTAPELDGVLAEAQAASFRAPYQSDPTMRHAINAGTTQYKDMHLSALGPAVRDGVFGPLDVAVVEVTAIGPDGRLVPSSSVGNNQTWLDTAKAVILEVNEWMSPSLAGMHDVYRPGRAPIPINAPGDRIGTPYLDVDPAKVVAVVVASGPDRNSAFKPVDATSEAIAAHLVDFLTTEQRAGRLPNPLPPLQSGVGNIANAVLAALGASGLRDLTSYTEVIQDGMLGLIERGVMTTASATAFSLSPEAAELMNRKADYFRRHIVLRPQEVSNSPEVIRRLGVISCNGMIEADIYGNVNSTHVSGSRMINGIGGSGDFTRNAMVSTFVTPSTAKGGA
ncbi:MAG: acetyl-CoA hydrolase, partial [Bifidobacteriaceae bacterium]|nr:acetyl-CoA hydrolase [Bifidobacteriaceae bacterium]